MATVTRSTMNMDIAAFTTGKNTQHPKFKKNWNVQCDYCKNMGHAKVDCYRLIGYPQDFKFKKKFGNQNEHNVRGGDQRTQTQAHFVKNDTGRMYNDEGGPSRATYNESHRDLPNNN
ncbi:hypothetical protein KY290_001465 [Solanum tuberosum]|uniref:Uncharacterized protein n=1 Tax=Solanum tuberosum TaxID=4113 RepID=A0ABQ7WM85_SOLTU|nr:hypothetical protein KY290_001465 [Solanum tuberosum]